MKILKTFFLITIILALFAACSSSSQNDPATNITPVDIDISATSSALPQHKVVTFETETHGKFVVETYPEYAPETVRHFISLVQSGYYNGFTIDTIEPSKAIFTSEDSSSASSNSVDAVRASTVVGEFTANGRSNTLKLDKYTLALWHHEDNNDSGKAKFFITLTSNHTYDGEYAGFAKVTQGKDVIDRIAGTETNAKGRPLSPIVIKKAYLNN